MLSPHGSSNLWQQMLPHIRERIAPQNFSIWLAPIRRARMEEDRLVVEIPNVHRLNGMRSTYRRPIGDAVARRIALREKHCPLTAREQEVLVLLAEGLTYEAIGERLGIAKRTARAHVVAIQEKFDAANNAQVVARGYERGLLKP